MIILPAIDIKDGNCVRLFKGDFSTVEKVAADYMETAKGFEAAGASWIHMVDLDGAKEGRPVNQHIYEDVAAKTGLKVEVGGGIRNLETIDTYLKNGMVATEGWLEESDTDYITLAKEMIAVGVEYFIVTDIAKDGTLSGVNLEQLKALRDATEGKCSIIASGGVHTIEDIRGCKELGLYGTICGKSIYKGTLDLREAIALAEGV